MNDMIGSNFNIMYNAVSIYLFVTAENYMCDVKTSWMTINVLFLMTNDKKKYHSNTLREWIFTKRKLNKENTEHLKINDKYL